MSQVRYRTLLLHATSYTSAAAGGDTSDLLSSQLTGREFGGSLCADDDPTAGSRFPDSSLSLSCSTLASERPTALLKSSESLVSVTSSSKAPSERSNISLTPPSRSARALRRRGSHLDTGRRLAVGLLLVVVIALSWVGSTQTAKSSLTGGRTKFNGTNFNSPFFVMWFGTGWMMAVYPLSCVVFFAVNRDKWSCSGVRELWR